MDVTYLQLLPHEVLEHIFSYLNTIDIIKLAEIATEFENVSHSKRIIEKVNLFCEYYVTKKHICKFLAKKPRCNFITSLNISCIYWIPAADIRKCISSLNNLECLYVVDTKMGFLKLDLLIYNKLPKLKKLGLSATKRTFCDESLKYFPKLTHFYLHVDSEAGFILRNLMFVLHKHNCLEEFWLIESGTICFKNPSDITIPRSVVKFNALLHNFFFREHSTEMKWIHRNIHTRTVGCWEKQDQRTRYFLNINFNEDWSTFFELYRNNVPFTPKQTKEIIDKESLDDMKFEEINFAHDENICGETYKQITGKLILDDNMKLLKKLAVNFCACISDDGNEGTSSSAKRQKRSNTCLLNRISENSPNIQELEIWPCIRVNGCNKITNDTCNAIANFKFLRKLTLDHLPIHINGSFLINVFISCKYLASLRIRSKQQNSSLHNMLCLSLKYAEALKDLRYEHPCNISIDRLFTALIENKKLKIERLFIKCKSVETLSTRPLHILLETNDDLRFLCLMIAELPMIVIRQVVKFIDEYNDDPRKILRIFRSEYPYAERIQVPFIHAYEMQMCLTHVAGLDVFNDYV